MLPGYLTYTRNRCNQSSGGISTSIITSEASDCVRVEEGKDNNEFLLTRRSQFDRPINVLNLYGQQECRMTKEEVENHWTEVLEVITRVEAREELLVVIGDANRHLG